MHRNNRRRFNNPKSANNDSHLEIDNEFAQYIREIFHNYENCEDDESKSLLIDNFIKEIPEGSERNVAQHGLGSKIIESLIGFSSPENFEKLAESLSSWNNLLTDKKATFVLEACIKTATLRALSGKTEESSEPAAKKSKNKSSDIEYNLASEFKSNHIEFCKSLVIKFSEVLVSDLRNFVRGQANYLVRTSVLCLAGIIKSSAHQSNLKVDYSKEIPEEWTAMLCQYSTCVQDWENLENIAVNEKTSTFIQNLLQALSNVDQHESLKKLIKLILKKCYKEEEGDEKSTANFFQSKPATFLFETILEHCDEKQFVKIYQKHFKSNLETMCDSELNFTVQRLIDATKSKEIFDEIFAVITKNFSTLLQNGRTGVVLAICKACERLSAKQGQFIQSLLRSLETEKAQNFTIQAVLALMPASVVEKQNSVEIHLHGSLMLQHMLNFSKPIKLVQLLLDMKPQLLSDIFCDSKGSRIADAYLSSKFIGEKSREKLVKHLEQMYLKLAMSKHGSHVLEKFYQISSDSQKEVVVQEVSAKINQLNSTPSGKIINYKFNAEAYARNPHQWKNFVSRTTK